MNQSEAQAFITRLLATSGPNGDLEVQILLAIGGPTADVFGSFLTSTDEALKFSDRLVGPGPTQTLTHTALATAWTAARGLHRDDWPQWFPRAIVAQALHVYTWAPSRPSKVANPLQTLATLKLDL